jgi:pimeloyl-ACP methyl ester carboxylesterase
MRDPVATERVLEGVLALRPNAPLTRMEDLGHYPQIERPKAISEVLRAAL